MQCAAGIPDSDPSKATLQKLQDADQNFTAEKGTLKSAGVFDGYDRIWGRVYDLATRDQVSNWAVGAVQGVGGAVAAAGAIGTGCTSAHQCVPVAHAIDGTDAPVMGEAGKTPACNACKGQKPRGNGRLHSRPEHISIADTSQIQCLVRRSLNPSTLKTSN